MLRVSVITVCYNNEHTIEATIKSVASQDYKNIEYILVDGASTDNTLSLIHQYKEHIATIISEKDNGIYFAINKGIELATGDVIAILHADDFYADSTVISKVIEVFETTHSETVYGDLQYVDRNDTSKIIRDWKAGVYSREQFLKGWMPPHPSFFAKRSCYLQYGSFNTTLKSSADY
ncbi:MAG TPA: glycosyltransferase family 2 protein, partial [Bacteroidia bacterium]|nr:glycosyltransferase family 2 protein [Bacteroidia bacterium]